VARDPGRGRGSTRPAPNGSAGHGTRHPGDPVIDRPPLEGRGTRARDPAHRRGGRRGRDHGLPGLRLGFTETLPSPQVVDDPTQVRRSLGDRADLAAAWSALEDGLLVPDVLGEPDEVYVGPAGSRPRIALVYRADGGDRPLMGDIALIVTEWMGGLDEAYARKWIRSPEGTAAEVLVGDSRGYWVGGVPHVLEYLDDQSGIRRPVTRLVGDVLVWQSGPIVYRIESPLGLDATLAIARSMRHALVSPPPAARPRPRAPGPWPR
jgi:hypothetical protein